MRPFSVRFRADEFADATSSVLDVLVVGGGATGAGIALDAASRGLRVALVERGDLAAGTSSRSTKLVHGGLRYLEQYDVALVREGVAERELLQRLAPHLVRPLDFVYPILPDTPRQRWFGLGLTTYDVLAGVRNVRRHERLTAEQAVARAPALARSGLLRAYVYGDCTTDDARLVLAVARAARRFGALVLTYAEVTRLRFGSDGRVTGALVRDRLDGTAHDLRARHVVNATGVWADRLLALEQPGRPPLVRPSKGVHLVVPAGRPTVHAAVVLPSAHGDRRTLFAIPWGRQTILGTTDTPYDGPLDEVRVDAADVDYVLAAVNAVFDLHLTAADVVGAWAGCRPLLRGAGGSAATRDLSRRHALSEGAAGLLTITGGKLTTYRRMAKDVVDRIVARDGRRAPCRTDAIRLGCTRPYEDVVADTVPAAQAAGVEAGDRIELATLLVGQYGDAAPAVLALACADGLGAPLSPAAPHLLAEVVYAARHEGAATLADVFTRRTRIALRARDAGLPAAPAAARLLAAELGRPASWAVEQVRAYAAEVRAERGALGLPDPGP